MLVIILICGISFLIGGSIGNRLAAQGITADINLEKHQGKILWVLIAIASIILSMYLLSILNLMHQVLFIIPTFIRLYIQAYSYKLILASGCLVLGLLVFLELSGKSSPRRMLQLSMAVVILTIPLTIFLHFCLPVTNSLDKPRVRDEVVVLQTTSYTCAPSSIATLARFIGKHRSLSERDVVKLTMTNRFGTSTLAEIRAMEKLGLNPKYKYGLTRQDLIKVDRPALLHVRLRMPGRVISHAVALLSVDSQQKVLTIADPLSGIQKMKFAQLKGYWLGEAVFVDKPNLLGD